MQISDEQVAAYKAAYNAEMARWSFEGGHIDPSFEASRVGLAAALSLPVQPVAWEPYQIAICIGAEVRRRNRVGKDDEAGSISPCCELAATILVLEALHDCGILPATTPPVHQSEDTTHAPDL